MKFSFNILSAAALTASAIAMEDAGVRGTSWEFKPIEGRNLEFHNPVPQGTSWEFKKQDEGRKLYHYGGKKGGKGGGGGCGGRFQRLNFVQEPFDFEPIFATGSSDTTDLGTVFLWNCLLYSDDYTPETSGDSVIGTTTGQCTRLDFDPGLAYCRFTYTVIDEGSIIGSIHVEGTLADGQGGTLSITGGTEEFVGADGEVFLGPVGEDGTPTDGDIMEGVTAYFGFAKLTTPHPYCYDW